MLRRPDLELSFVNAGVGGNSAWDGLRRLDSDVLAEHPSVVFVNFGMNDAAAPSGHHADFLNNMEAIFQKLRAGNVRRIVWVEPSPMDVFGGASATAIHRQARIDQFVAAIRQRPAEPDITIVHWNEPMKLAVTKFRVNGGGRLISDRIHPGPSGHALMAAELLRGIGADISPATVDSVWSEGILTTKFQRLVGPSQSWVSVDVPMESGGEATVDVSGLVPPVPFISGTEAIRLNSDTVESVRALRWRVKGLASGHRFSVNLGDDAAGEYSAAQLAEGVDLMNGVKRAVISLGYPENVPDACVPGHAFPFQNEANCAVSLVYKKDQLRLLIKSDRTHLPDIVPDRLTAYLSFIRSWVQDVEAHNRETLAAMRQRPHLLRLRQIQ